MAKRCSKLALLRRGWIPSNVNASVKNAARFDIVAQGPQGQLVPIRVKTCGIGQEAFQYGFVADRPAAGTASPGMTGRSDQMRQATTAQVRLDQGKGGEFRRREAGNPTIWLPTRLVAIELHCGAPLSGGQSHSTDRESGENVG